MSPQTPHPPAPRPTLDRRAAKDVARHLDRRRTRRKLLVWTLVLGAIVIAVLYLRFGRGLGLGLGGWGIGTGDGDGDGDGPGSVQPLLSPADAGPRRCEVRVAASGITVDGKPATVDEAVAACQGVTAAEVLVTGGAREADWEDLKAALDRAGIRILRVEPEGGSGSGSGSGT